MNYRTQIAEGFAVAIRRLGVPGLKVHAALDRPLDPRSDFPVAVIYTMDSKRGPTDYGNSITPRVVQVMIEMGVVADPEDTVGILDKVQEMTDAAEALILADATLGHVVNDARWQQTVSDVSSMGDIIVGVALLEYEVDVYTQNGTHSPTEPDWPLNTPETVLAIGQPKPRPDDDDDCCALVNPDLACGPGGCDVPAWAGEGEP